MKLPTLVALNKDAGRVNLRSPRESSFKGMRAMMQPRYHTEEAVEELPRLQAIKIKKT